VDKLQPGVERNFLAAVDVLRGFSDVEEGVTLPDYPYNDMAGAIIDAEAASAFEELFTSGRITGLTAPEDRIGGYAGQVMLAKDYLRAVRLRGPAAAALDAMLAGYDAIAGPTLPTVAWPIDTPFDKVYPEYPGGTTIDGAANLCGVPGLFVVNGLGEGGLPTSLQLTGRAGTEGLLLELGMQFQARTTHHQLRPAGF
jgi:aspartyl-tRNA(Asn)/glutamyl-tRNA(Gln) amidotransferase subunit A